LGGVHLFATVGRVGRSPPVVGPSTWLPERDPIAVITRVGTHWDPTYPLYDIDVRGEPIRIDIAGASSAAPNRTTTLVPR
jgi:hypothetical protein